MISPFMGIRDCRSNPEVSFGQVLPGDARRTAKPACLEVGEFSLDQLLAEDALLWQYRGEAVPVQDRLVNDLVGK